MLLEARHGSISRNYAPLHGWVWGLLDGVGIPPGFVFLLGVGAFVTSVLVLVKQFLPDRAARITTVVIVLFPPVYGLLGLVTRDVWFTTSVLVITAAVWHVSRQAEPPSIRMITLLVVSAGVAADARQNGAPFAVLAVGTAALGTVRNLRPHAGWVIRIASVAAALAVFFPGLLVAQRAVIGHRVFPEQSLYASDLVGASLTGNKLLLDDFLFPAQDLSVLRRQVQAFDMAAVVYAYPPIVRHRNEDAAVNMTWRKQWREMIREHPFDYLVWRTKLYLAQLGVTHRPYSTYYEESVERENGLKPDVDNQFQAVLEARNEVLSTVAGPPTPGSLVALPVLYLVGGFGGIALVGRRNREWGPSVALLVVLTAMQAILFFTAPGSEFRFQYFQIVIGLTFASIAIAQSRSRKASGSLRSCV